MAGYQDIQPLLEYVAVKEIADERTMKRVGYFEIRYGKDQFRGWADVLEESC